MRIKDLIEKGLIRKAKVREEEISGSLRIAGRFLDRAKGNMRMEYYDVAFILAYNAMFHTARALLFKLGYKERSHFVMIEVLKAKYRDQKIQEFLKILDSYRISRHAIQYGGSFCSEEDAEEFLAYVKRWLKKNES